MPRRPSKSMKELDEQAERIALYGKLFRVTMFLGLVGALAYYYTR